MIEQQPNNIPQQAFNDDQAGAINLHDIIRMILVNWYWFVLSVLVCLGVAYYYLAKTPKIYSRTATILVKDSRKGGAPELSAFSDLASFQTQRSVDNEIYILQSRRLMSEVVRRLNLTESYSIHEHLHALCPRRHKQVKAEGRRTLGGNRKFNRRLPREVA